MKDAPEEVIGARALSSLSFSPFRAFVGHYFLPLPFKRLLRSLVPRRSLLIRCPREVWERAGDSR